MTPNATRTFTIRPNQGLEAGAYSPIITVTGSGGASVQVQPAFTVSAVHIPPTDIVGVPTEATVGTPLTLSGTVVPLNATNNIIMWSVVSAGTTGATISGDTLYATAPGYVTVRATIVNGTGAGDFTRDFAITVNAAVVDDDDVPTD
jgi:hypothetical protein